MKQRKAIAGLVLAGAALAFAGGAAAQLADTAWPMFGHDARHTGLSPYVGSQTPDLKWRSELPGNVECSPAIGLGRMVYVVCTVLYDPGPPPEYNDFLYEIGPDDGRWSCVTYFETCSLHYSTPAIGVDGTIYIARGDGLYAFTPGGDLKWNVGTYTHGSSPAIAPDGTIFIGCVDNYLYAIGPDGDRKWRYETGGQIRSSPAIGEDGTIYVGSQDDRLYAVNPDGSLRWSYPMGDDVDSSPAVAADGTIYFGSRDNNLYALNPDGTLRWTYPTGGDVGSPAIGPDGTICASSSDGYLYAVTPGGGLRWSYKTAAQPPAIGRDGTIYVATGSVVRAISPNGTLKWEYAPPTGADKHLAIAEDGTIYAASGSPDVYAIRTGVPCAYVDQNSSGPVHDGTSWDTAFLTIQDAVDHTPGDGEVWVADGVYVENVVMYEGVAVYGGFVGAEPGGYETKRRQRDFMNNVTTINGNQKGSCVVMAPDTTVDGFLIANGSGTVIGDLAYGGGIYCPDLGQSGAVANNVLWYNWAGYCGGGIYLFGSSPSIAGNLFLENFSRYGAAIYCREDSSPTVASNIFAGNDAVMYGGAVRIWRSSPVLVNNTFAGNSAGAGAGAVHCDYSSLSFSNNIVASNSGGGIACGTDVTAALTCNDFWENAPFDYEGCDPGEGDISADPVFVDPDGGDFHLTAASPCIEAGDNAAPGLPECDFEGDPRVLDGDEDSVPIVDIGADEYSPFYVLPGVAVDQNAPGPVHDGSSWHTAFLTIQEGVDAATPGRDVWVADGVYFESVVLGEGVAIYGGFLGAEPGGYETELDQRDFAANVTTIDGNRSGRCVLMAHDTQVDGFTITNGYAAHSPGIACGGTGDTAVIANNTIVGNTAVDEDGGGINGGSPLIINNLILYNGAGMYGVGGGIYGESPTIINNIIGGNWASYAGGAGIFLCGAAPTVTNNTITGNLGEGQGHGGGIYLSGVGPSGTVSNNIIAANGRSGIACTEGAAPTLSHNDVWGHEDTDYYGCEPGDGDISADPMFVDPSSGDFHIRMRSPCTDAGTNDAPGLPEADWEGEGRITNGVVDIGADEYVTIHTEAPDPQPECEGPLFGGSQAGFPAWVWFSIPLTPDCVAGSGCGNPNALLGLECDGRLWYWDKCGKWLQVYKEPFLEWELSVGNSYLLYLDAGVANPSYEGIAPFTPWTFEFKLGKMGWTWIGMPGLTELGGSAFMDAVRVKYPSDDSGEYRAAQHDYDAIPGNWVSWGWPFYDTYLQAPKTFTPYAPFGNRTCYPWLGYRVWVNVGTAETDDDPDQVTLVWPGSRQ